MHSLINLFTGLERPAAPTEFERPIPLPGPSEFSFPTLWFLSYPYAISVDHEQPAYFMAQLLGGIQRHTGAGLDVNYDYEMYKGHCVLVKSPELAARIALALHELGVAFRLEFQPDTEPQTLPQDVSHVC